MDYYVKSVIPIIESNYENFTALEKNIADFFMKNEEKMDFSAKEIAKHLFVSEASLSRFAKKCGFRGYREFIYQYEESFEEKNKELTGHTRTVLNMYQELLNKTYSLMDEAQIVRICEKLGQAKRVFVCGKGSSGLAAREMRLRFMRIGVDINSIQDPDLMRMQAVFQKEGCLVIGISISGESEDVCYLLEESKKRGAGWQPFCVLSFSRHITRPSAFAFFRLWQPNGKTRVLPGIDRLYKRQEPPARH